MNVGDVVGNYKITRVIGGGGMGVVYLAEHNLIGREAAIKVLLPSLSNKQDIVQRFFNEAKTTSSIKHPGIVEIFDFGYSDQGHAFIVMEYLEGETLDARIQRLGNMPPRDALAMLGQISRALGAAHELGVVHRDLKPENIYIVSDPEVTNGERTKILDFGIAKLRNAGNVGVRTASGQVMGPPGYMAPEQCLGAADVDPRADIYALGCILFDMLCGRPPFESPNFADVLAAHVSKEPPSPSSVVPRLTPVIDGLVGDMLQKAPENRPQSTVEVLKRIEAVVSQLAGNNAPSRQAKASVPPPIPTAARKGKTSKPPPVPGANLDDSRAPLPPLPQSKPKAPPVPRAAANARTMYEGESTIERQPRGKSGQHPAPHQVSPQMTSPERPTARRQPPPPSQPPEPAMRPMPSAPAKQQLGMAATQQAPRMQPTLPPQPRPPQVQPPQPAMPQPQPMQPMPQPMQQPMQPPQQPLQQTQPPAGAAGPHGTFALAPANQMEPLAPAQQQAPAPQFADPLRPMRPVQIGQPAAQQPVARGAGVPSRFEPRAIAEPPAKEGSGVLLPFLLVLLVGGLAAGFFIYRSMSKGEKAAGGDTDAAVVATAGDGDRAVDAGAKAPTPDAKATPANPVDAAPATTADAATVALTTDAAPATAPVDAAPAPKAVDAAAEVKPPTVEPGSGRVIDPALGSASGVATVTLKITSRPNGALVTRKFDNLKLGKTPLEYVTKKFNANEEFVVELAKHYPVGVKMLTNRDGARQVLLLKKR